jgi:hypothetical protein
LNKSSNLDGDDAGNVVDDLPTAFKYEEEDHSISGFYENFFSRDGRMREGFLPRGRASTLSESSPLLPVDEGKTITKK